MSFSHICPSFFLPVHMQEIENCWLNFHKVWYYKMLVWVEALTVVRMKMVVFWVVALYRLVWAYLTNVSEVCAASFIIALMMVAVQTSETLVTLYQSVQRYNPEYSHLLVILY
jgi:hypothetical protein